jgi:hypothetical protein
MWLTGGTRRTVQSKRLTVLTGVVFVVAVATLLILTRGPRVLRHQAELRASGALGVAVKVGGLRLGRGPSLELTDITSDVASAALISIQVELMPLLRHRVVINNLRVDSLRVHAVPLPESEEPSVEGGSSWGVEVRHFELRDAGVQLHAGGIDAVERLFASGRYSYGSAGQRLDLEDLRCSLSGPDLQVMGVAGELSQLKEGLTSVRMAVRTSGTHLGLDASLRKDTGDIRLSLAAPQFDLSELRPWLGDLPVERGQLRLDADGALPDIRFAVSGSLGDSVAIVVAGSARLDPTRPRAMWAGRGRFAGSPSGSPSILSGLFCGAADGTTLRVGLRTLPPSRWGEYSVSGASVLAAVHDSLLTVAVRAAIGPGGELSLAGRGSLGTRRCADSRVAFRAVDLAAYGGPPTSLSGEASVGFAGEGCNALVRLGPSVVGDTRIDGAQAAAGLGLGTVDVGGAVAVAPWGSAVATGRWREGDVRVRAVAHVDSARCVYPDGSIDGTMFARVLAAGRWPRLTGEAAVLGSDVAWGDAGFQSAAVYGAVSGVPDQVTGYLAVLGGKGRAGWLHTDSVIVFGSGSVAATRYILKLDGQEVMLHASGRSRDRTLLVSGAQVRLGDVRLQTTRPWEVSIRPDGVSLDTLSMAALGCSLAVEGGVRTGRGHGSIVLVGLDLSRVASFAPVLATASGQASLRGKFEGPPWTGSGTLMVRNGEYRGAGFSLLSADVAAAAGKATVQGRVEQRGVERLHLTAGATGEDWTARVLIEKPDLSAVPALVPGLARLSGALEGDLLLHGRGPALRSVEGSVGLSDGLVRVEPLSQDFRGVRFTVTVEDDTWKVSDLSVQSDGGRAVGWAVYDSGTPDGQLVLERLPLKGTVGGAGVLDGTVRLSAADGEPRVSGRITVQEAQVRIDELAGRGPPGEGPGVLTLPPWAEPVRGELTVAIPRNCWIRTADLEVEIAGELRVTKDADAVQLWGEVETLRGSYRFQGKVFTVTQGRVSFTGSEVPDPTLQVEAQHRLRDRLTGEEITVFVDLTGTATAPVVALRSEPPMEEVDILSYLLLGRPSTELVTAEQNALVRSVSGLLAGQATQRLARSVGRALGLDTFEIETAGAPALRLGSYLGGRVYFEYTQELKTEGARGIRLDYHLGKGFSLEATSTTLGDTGLDLVWSREF